MPHSPDYDERDELRLLEAIVWGATQFEDVDGVILQVEGQQLTEMPKRHTPLNMPLTREIASISLRALPVLCMILRRFSFMARRRSTARLI